MSTARRHLFDRLPEIYRERDAEQTPPHQLKAFLGAIDEVFGALRNDIEGLYHNLFIETCDDWVIPYIADLVGTTHLAGDVWTLRADVARTIALRRRKGTLGAVELLAHSLTRWAAHAVEMRDRLVWNQHLNHQRPDVGGTPPLRLVRSLSAPARGGIVNLRSPAVLSLLDGAFDPFAHVVDSRPPGSGYNLPNLAVLLWRLRVFTVPASKPFFRGPIVSLTAGQPGDASFAVRFDLHPLGEPTVPFNTHRFRGNDEPPDLSLLDAVPGPVPRARITDGVPGAAPDQYVRVVPYLPPRPRGPEKVGLTLHLPDVAALNAIAWRIRGANLCAWEAGLAPPLRAGEVVIDPDRGRFVLGTAAAASLGTAIRDKLLVSATYGLAGPTGAHPVDRADLAPGVVPRVVDWHTAANPATALQEAFDDLDDATDPVVIEIRDSMTHTLDLSAVTGVGTEGGLVTLRLGSSLHVRAADGERPVIRLTRPLAFRLRHVTGVDAGVQEKITVTLEGLYLTRGAGFTGDALIERAAIGALAIEGCTLDPGGYVQLDGTRAPLQTAIELTNSYGFANATEERDFTPTPRIVLRRSIAGALLIDRDHHLRLEDSIIDAGGGVASAARPLAVRAATGDPELEWGPALEVERMTCFGRMRVAEATGRGGIWVQRLEVHQTLTGCIRYSYLSGDHDRLPQHHACVFGPRAFLAFTRETYGSPGYAQLAARVCDRRILEEGPDADEMGAFGYLLSTHKWKNLEIRLREFVPVDVRPVLIPIT